jgi:hypothetical protein
MHFLQLRGGGWGESGKANGMGGRGGGNNPQNERFWQDRESL